MKAAYDFTLDAPYSTGTVTATLGSSDIVGASTAWSATLILPKDIFFVDGSSVVYHVSTQTSSTALTLETEFSEDTTADSGYTIARNQYKLPKETDHLVSFIVNSQDKMIPLGLADFRRVQASQAGLTGQPKYYTLSRRDTDDDAVYIEVYPSPDKSYQCHIDYTVRIMFLEDTTTCYPIIPDRYRSVLYYGALAEFFMFLRDPSGSQLAEGQYRTFLNQMRNDTQQTDDRFVVVVERDYKNRIPRARHFNGTTTIDDFGRED
jgi:hypothetical protein